MSYDFQVIDSSLLVDAPILGVRRDTVTMPGGKTAEREIVEHFGAVAVVAYDSATDSIMMVEQYRHSVGSRLLELPAGLLDFADEPAITCAQRELHEEAGLEAKEWSLLVDLVTSPGFCEEAVRVYLATDLSQIERPEGKDEEADLDDLWVPLDEAVEMIMTGKIVNSIAISGIFAAWQVIREDVPSRNIDVPFELRPQNLAARRQSEGFTGDMKKRKAQ